MNMFGYKDLKEKTYLFNDFCQIFNLDILDISDISDDFPVKIIYEKDKKIDDMCISRVSIIFKKDPTSLLKISRQKCLML